MAWSWPSLRERRPHSPSFGDPQDKREESTACNCTLQRGSRTNRHNDCNYVDWVNSEISERAWNWRECFNLWSSEEAEGAKSNDGTNGFIVLICLQDDIVAYEAIKLEKMI